MSGDGAVTICALPALISADVKEDACKELIYRVREAPSKAITVYFSALQGKMSNWEITHFLRITEP